MMRILQQLSMDFTNNRALPSQDKSAQGAWRETHKTPKEGGRLRKNISKYCWTHGACSHSSAECHN